MRKVVLFIAMSLDGYIADKNGRVDWLKGQDINVETEDAYSALIKEIDTVVMGFTTYHQIITELSPSEWVYRDLNSYVITHRNIVSDQNIQFVQESPNDLIQRLKKQNGKNIWICGGANIVQQLLQENMIDTFHLSIIPTILGDGIRLFGALDTKLQLKLTNIRHYNGITEVLYEKR